MSHLLRNCTTKFWYSANAESFVLRDGCGLWDAQLHGPKHVFLTCPSPPELYSVLANAAYRAGRDFTGIYDISRSLHGQLRRQGFSVGGFDLYESSYKTVRYYIKPGAHPICLEGRRLNLENGVWIVNAYC